MPLYDLEPTKTKDYIQSPAEIHDEKVLNKRKSSVIFKKYRLVSNSKREVTLSQEIKGTLKVQQVLENGWMTLESNKT